MRLCEQDSVDFACWKKARLDAWRSRYGDAHLGRYLVADAAEELIDASNCILLLIHRMGIAVGKGEVIPGGLLGKMHEVQVAIGKALVALQELDRMLPSALCTDEAGGERVWWSEAQRRREAEDGCN